MLFITAHPNPSNHFVEYIRAYEERGYECTVVAGENVASKFSGLKARVVPLENLSGEIASKSVVITDIANEKWIELHQTLAKEHPSVTRAVYYDNPENLVPGGYSELAARIVLHVQTILFANASLPEKGIKDGQGNPIDLTGKNLVGIGYYPMAESEKIISLRESCTQTRASLFEKNGIEDRGQRVFVYAGGANQEYYEKAFPHFIKLIKESPLADIVLVLQQHPRAKTEGNIDANLLRTLPKNIETIVSDISTNEALSIAEGVFYYQTSMAAQFALAGIPTVIQIGHDTYEDVLIRSGYPSVTTKDQLRKELATKPSSSGTAQLADELGIDPNWKDNLTKSNLANQVQ